MRIHNFNCDHYYIRNEKVCKYCSTLTNTVINKKKRINTIKKLKRVHLSTTPSKSAKLKILRHKTILIKQSKQRATMHLMKLKTQFKKYESKLSNLGDDYLSEMAISNSIPYNQQLIIKEIVESSKRKNSKRNRYTENWPITLRMLLHIRSPN